MLLRRGGGVSRAATAAVVAAVRRAQLAPLGTVDRLVQEKSQGISPDGRDEAGAVRPFRTGRVVTSDRIVALQAGRRFACEDARTPFLKN